MGIITPKAFSLQYMLEVRDYHLAGKAVQGLTCRHKAIMSFRSTNVQNTILVNTITNAIIFPFTLNPFSTLNSAVNTSITILQILQYFQDNDFIMPKEAKLVSNKQEFVCFCVTLVRLYIFFQRQL